MFAVVGCAEQHRERRAVRVGAALLVHVHVHAAQDLRDFRGLLLLLRGLLPRPLARFPLRTEGGFALELFTLVYYAYFRCLLLSLRNSLNDTLSN